MTACDKLQNDVIVSRPTREHETACELSRPCWLLLLGPQKMGERSGSQFSPKSVHMQGDLDPDSSEADKAAACCTVSGSGGRREPSAHWLVRRRSAGSAEDHVLAPSGAGPEAKRTLEHPTGSFCNRIVARLRLQFVDRVRCQAFPIRVVHRPIVNASSVVGFGGRAEPGSPGSRIVA
jgi:hypothetical protein